MKKKLTFGGGMPLVLSVFAFLLGAAAAASEFIGRAIYNFFFESGRDYILSAGKYMYVQNYGRAVLLFAVSAVYLFMLVKSRKKKSIGSFEAVFSLLSGMLLLMYSAVYAGHMIKTDSLLKYTGITNSELFLKLFREGVEAVVILGSLALTLSALSLIARLSGESFCVKVEKRMPLVFEVDEAEPVVVEGIRSVMEVEVDGDTSEDEINNEDAKPSEEVLAGQAELAAAEIKDEPDENQVTFDSLNEPAVNGGKA